MKGFIAVDVDKKVPRSFKIAFSIPPLRWLAMSLFQRPISPRELSHVDLRKGKVAKIDLNGKVVLITGASSGMGRDAAVLFAREGARVIAVARSEDELEKLVSEIHKFGGIAEYFAVDVTQSPEVDELVKKVTDEIGTPDIVVNNAGRSIRRSVLDEFDRFHDFERTMAVNYFAAVQLTLGFLPGMVARSSGHFINISSWGTQIECVPKYSAYLASKAALQAFGRCVGLDVAKTGVKVTTVFPPLVRTAMTEPTEAYRGLPMLSSQQAAEWMIYAAKNQPREVIPKAARHIRFWAALHPALGELLCKYTMPI